MEHMSLREKVSVSYHLYLFYKMSGYSFLLFSFIDNQFFWNCDYLDDYLKAPDSKKTQYPGHAYFDKINQFITAHYCIGELYFEFTRGSCQDSLGENSFT